MAVEPKVIVNFRTAVVGREWLDEVAEDHRVDRADVIRAALQLAKRHKKELDDLIEVRR